MYSGLVLTKYSGRVMGTHQKIDRVARKHLAEIIDNNDDFPSIKELLEFEGKNGPDGIKRKSPSYNEPWHFLNPLANDNSNFMKLLDTHYTGLVKHLKDGNHEACAFEASWLAHAIVDGLTPAHHYPYDEKLSEMLVDGKEGRNSIKTKLLFMGETKLKTLQNTYKAYGPRGLMTAHVAFEYGVALLIKPLGLPDARPVDTDFDELEQWGYRDYFMNRAKEVAVLDIYEQYLASGWTSKLSNRVRHSLLPVLVKSVTMLWYSAMKEAGKIK
ncbi:hypothetical protein KC867_03570 [Candidatus Saccharibacteria bacterium]|nr:hypothetical protein [Candidatus Saccharibacteria bacterium]